MKRSTEVVAVERPVVGTAGEVSTYIARATAAGTLIGYTRATELSSGRYMITATVRELRPVKPAPKRPTVVGEIGKALAFVAVIVVAVLALIAGLIAFLSSRLPEVSVAGLIGFGVTAIAVGYLLVNRSSHSGACPGMITHCKGCRH